MDTMVHVLMQVATQVQSGWTEIVLGEHPDGAEELDYELLKGLV